MTVSDSSATPGGRSIAFPIALGVIYADPAPAYDEAVTEQVAAAKKQKGEASVDALLRQGHTWKVE